MPENPEFQKRLDAIKPDIEKLIQKLQLPDSVISGFIMLRNPQGLIRFGNNANKGADLIKLHLCLSSYAAEIESHNPNFADVSFADVGDGDGSFAGINPDEIAYQLAKTVLASGLESGHTEEALALAEQYINITQKRNN